MGLFAKIMVSGFHFLQQKPWQLFLAKKLEKYELRVRDESPWVKAWMHGEPSIRGSHSSAFHAANLKKYFSFEDEERDRSQGGEELNQATGQAFAEKGRWSVHRWIFGNLAFSPGAEKPGEEPRCAAHAHTSAPSSRTPVSITVTYLSSIWTRSTVLSMWDLVLGSLLQGTHR